MASSSRRSAVAGFSSEQPASSAISACPYQRQSDVPCAVKEISVRADALTDAASSPPRAFRATAPLAAKTSGYEPVPSKLQLLAPPQDLSGRGLGKRAFAYEVQRDAACDIPDHAATFLTEEVSASSPQSTRVAIGDASTVSLNSGIPMVFPGMSGGVIDVANAISMIAAIAQQATLTPSRRYTLNAFSCGVPSAQGLPVLASSQLPIEIFPEGAFHAGFSVSLDENARKPEVKKVREAVFTGTRWKAARPVPHRKSPAKQHAWWKPDADSFSASLVYQFSGGALEFALDPGTLIKQLLQLADLLKEIEKLLHRVPKVGWWFEGAVTLPTIGAELSFGLTEEAWVVTRRAGLLVKISGLGASFSAQMGIRAGVFSFALKLEISGELEGEAQLVDYHHGAAHVGKNASILTQLEVLCEGVADADWKLVQVHFAFGVRWNLELGLGRDAQSSAPGICCWLQLGPAEVFATEQRSAGIEAVHSVEGEEKVLFTLWEGGTRIVRPIG